MVHEHQTNGRGHQLIKTKLLLVDDAALFLSMEQSFLTRETFEIHTATSGIDALKTARSVMPDLILLDLYMPDMNGDEVCARLKEDPETAAIPVLIITSNRNDEALERCAEAGCEGFLYKPLSKEAFLAAVEELLVVAQRDHKRVPTEIECDIKVGDTSLETVITNISAGGAFIKMGIPPDPGSRFDVNFSVPGTDHPVTAEVTVQWSASVSGKGHMGVGVDFQDLDKVERNKIENFVKNALVTLRKSTIGTV